MHDSVCSLLTRKVNVGDIVKATDGQFLPADVVLISSRLVTRVSAAGTFAWGQKLRKPQAFPSLTPFTLPFSRW